MGKMKGWNSTVELFIHALIDIAHMILYWVPKTNDHSYHTVMHNENENKHDGDDRWKANIYTG